MHTGRTLCVESHESLLLDLLSGALAGRGTPALFCVLRPTNGFIIGSKERFTRIQGSNGHTVREFLGLYAFVFILLELFIIHKKNTR